MDKVEVIEKMMNSENGGLYAAIGGIVLVYGIDRVTKSRYKVRTSRAKTEKGGVGTDHSGTAFFYSIKLLVR